MIYTVEKICRDARVAMQRDPEAPPIAGCECYALSLDELIESKIVEAVREVHMHAMPYLLDGGHNLDPQENEQAGGIRWTRLDANAYSGRIVLPPDFMRLIAFQMDDWAMASYVTFDINDSMYEVQRCGFAGLRGSPQVPMCFLGVAPEGRILEFFCCGSNEAHIKMAMYVPEPVIDPYGGIEISERCYAAVINKIVELIGEVS